MSAPINCPSLLARICQDRICVLFWSSTAASSQLLLFLLASCPLRGPLRPPATNRRVVLSCLLQRSGRLLRCYARLLVLPLFSLPTPSRPHEQLPISVLGLRFPSRHPPTTSFFLFLSYCVLLFLGAALACRSPHVESESIDFLHHLSESRGLLCLSYPLPLLQRKIA